MQCKPSEPCYRFGGKLNTMSGALNRSRSSSGLAITQDSSSSSMRRRTVGEALVRAGEQGSPIWRGFKRIPFFKPYAYGLQGLTYALILIDPLDRLDGGLID